MAWSSTFRAILNDHWHLSSPISSKAMSERRFISMFSSARVAPLPPSFLKLLSDTVTTLAVFTSLMYLLGGEVNCILSVPSCTCDPTFSVARVVKFVGRQLLQLLRQNKMISFLFL